MFSVGIGVVAWKLWIESQLFTDVYRYKLTLTVDTPDGPRMGESVAEVTYTTPYGLASTVTREGEAVVVDLGPHRPPLVALMSDFIKSYRMPRTDAFRDHQFVWDGAPAPKLFRSIYGVALEEYNDPARFRDRMLSVLAHAREAGPRPIPPIDLPDLVTFTDTNDPRTIIEVAPQAMGETLGTGVSLRSATFEITDAPIRESIETKLPFLDTPGWYCDLRRYDWLEQRKTVVDVGVASFKQISFYKMPTWRKPARCPISDVPPR